MVWKSCTKSFTWRYLSCSLFASIKIWKTSDTTTWPNEMFSKQLVQNKTGDRDYFLQKKHKIVGKGSQVSCQMLVWVISLIMLMIKVTLKCHWFWWIDKRWNKSGSCCVSFEIWGLQNTPRLWKWLSDFSKKSWAVQCGWNTRWSFVDQTILFFLKNWEVYLFDACRSWSILTISWVSNSFSENYWCFLSWICSWSWLEWLWTNYWCELSEKCSQTEFVWLLWNWWYFRIGWGCSSFGSMNWLNFFLSWCWCSQDLLCPSFSLFSFGCFKCVFCFFFFCFSFWIWVFKIQQIRFSKTDSIQCSSLINEKRSNTKNSLIRKRLNSVLFQLMNEEVTQQIWIKQMQIGEIREKQGAALCLFTLSYLCLILRALTKKTKMLWLSLAQKQIQDTDWVEKTSFFLFFLFVISSVSPVSSFQNSSHSTIQKIIFSVCFECFVIFYNFCPDSLCFAVWDIKIKKKKQNNLMTTLTDWHSWFYCCFLKNYHKKNEFNQCYFSVKGKDVVFGVFHCFRNKAPKHTISSVNGYVWVVKSTTPIICIFEWNLKQNFCHNEN